MNAEDIKIGMKVVPHSKSYAGNFETSAHINRAKDNGQPYLFVNAFVPKRFYVLGFTEAPNNAYYGDFYTAEDFEPYEDNES